MHKSNTILAVDVARINISRFFFVPFNLISSDAISANLTNTVPPTGAKEPYSTYFLAILTVVDLNRYVVIESMVKFLVKEFEIVSFRGTMFILLDQCLYLIVGQISFIIMESWNEAPWNIIVVHNLKELIVVMFPET
jgi:hypothetical protein